MIFELLVAAVLVPLLALVVLSTRQDLRKLEGDLLAHLDQTSESLASRIGTWRDRHLRAIVELAKSAGERGLAPAALQPDVELVYRMFPELATVYVANGAGFVEAAAPLTDVEGRSQLGVSVTDRPWLAAARDQLRPVVTSVYRGTLGRREPVVAIAAPVVRGNVATGIVVGALDLKQLRGLLELYAPSKSAQLTLTDAHAVVIASTMPGMLPLSSYRVEGELQPLGDGHYQHFPGTRGRAAIDRWRSSLYGRENRRRLPPWRLRVELPLAPLQQFLQERYSKPSAPCSGSASSPCSPPRRCRVPLSRSLARLAEAPRLPERWLRASCRRGPRSRVAEVDSLARNFRRMAGALGNASRSSPHRAALSERSVELAAANRELESEVANGAAPRGAAAARRGGQRAGGVARAAAVLERIARGCVPGLADWSLAVLDRQRRRRGWRWRTGRTKRRRACRSSPRWRRRCCRSDSPTSRCCSPLRWTGRWRSATASAAVPRGRRHQRAALLPLRARGKTLGAMVLARGGADAFDPPGDGLAEELARAPPSPSTNAALYAELREA